MAMVLVISKDDLRELLTFDDCIAAVERAHVEAYEGHVVLPVRTRLFHSERRGSMGIASALLKQSGAMGVKVQCSFQENPARGLPMITGVMLLQDADTGVPLAIMDSAYITAVRTPSASAIATKYLSREDSRVLAIVGAGVQARGHLRAMTLVRPIESVRVASRSRTTAELFKAEMELETGLPIEVCESPEEAVRGADIVCTTTLSPTPVVEGGWLSPGAHVNAVGAHSLETRELDSEAITMARVVVDSLDAAQKEAGDVMIPVREGVIGFEHVAGEIGDIVAGAKPGRQSPDEITVYKSLGVGIQDVATGYLVYHKALRLGLGTRVEL